MLSQMLHRVNSGTLVGPAIFLTKLFEQLPQILEHGVFFVRARAIGDKELLAQVQCLSLHCRGTKPIPYRSQELISVPLIFSRVPCVTNRSHIELIERYCVRAPIERRDRIRDQRIRPTTDDLAAAGGQAVRSLKSAAIASLYVNHVYQFSPTNSRRYPYFLAATGITPTVVDRRYKRIQSTSYRNAIRDSRIATFANRLVWVC